MWGKTGVTLSLSAGSPEPAWGAALMETPDSPRLTPQVFTLSSKIGAFGLHHPSDQDHGSPGCVGRGTEQNITAECLRLPVPRDTPQCPPRVPLAPPSMSAHEDTEAGGSGDPRSHGLATAALAPGLPFSPPSPVTFKDHSGLPFCRPLKADGITRCREVWGPRRGVVAKDTGGERSGGSEGRLRRDRTAGPAEGARAAACSPRTRGWCTT